MSFEDNIQTVAKIMRADFDEFRSLTTHPGLKGDSAESIVRTFLRSYLPKNLEISTGHITDSNKKISKQIDVIIHDRDHTPVLSLSKENHTKLIPVECVYAVVEVKSFIDKRAIKAVLENMKSVRALEKKAFYPAYDGDMFKKQLYGKTWEDWPINYYVFAFGSINLQDVAVELDQEHKKQKLTPNLRIDTICVLGKGLVTNKLKKGQFSPIPDNESVLHSVETDKELLLFYVLISHLLLQVNMRQFKLIDYISPIKFGKGIPAEQK
jgi:hypothetical protein